MSDVDDRDDDGVVIDGVDHPVLAAAGTEEAGKVGGRQIKITSAKPGDD
jgi:hypothetical protein